MSLDEVKSKIDFTAKELTALCKAVNGCVLRCEYGITQYKEEYVTVIYDNTYRKKINVTSDSLRAIAIDVIKEIH